MPVRPRFGSFDMAEGSALLQGLYLANIVQLQKGAPGIIRALASGRLRYIRRDRGEHWRTIREIWRYGGGDCEDLAAGAAAELTYRGEPAQPVVYRVNRRLAHVVVQLDDGRLLDPSILGGMGKA